MKEARLTHHSHEMEETRSPDQLRDGSVSRAGETAGLEIAFLMPVIPQARFKRRVHGLRELGVSPNVFSFSRSYVDDDRSVEVRWTDLGNVVPGNYIRRLRAIIRAVGILRRRIGDADVLYAFGLDLLLIAYLARIGRSPGPKLAYEVGDIRAVLLGRGARSTVARMIEKYLVARTEILVVTSEAYYTEYFSSLMKPGHLPPGVVVENKVEPDLLPAHARKGNITLDWDLRLPLKIGFFGLLRCPRAWDILARTVSARPDRFEVLIRGLPLQPASLATQAMDLDGVHYGGTFLSPSDLPELYSSVDMVWAAYPWEGASPGNSRWARTNRFYEACFFGRPLLVQRGTEDARVVDEHDIGLSIDMSTVDGAVEQLLEITIDRVERWRANLRRHPRRIYAHGDEHERLYRALTDSRASLRRTPGDKGGEERSDRRDGSYAEYVQYGCGFCAPATWRNFDASPTLRFERLPLVGRLYTKNVRRFPANVEYGDIVRGLPVPLESCRAVYCSHVLEHLALEDLRKALVNSYRILRPQGLFRLVVPDLEALAREYLESEDATSAHRFMEASKLGRKQRRRDVVGIIYTSFKSEHLWMWDFKSLRYELLDAGFREVRRAAMGDSEDARFADVEDQRRFGVRNLAIECRK